MDGDGNSLSVLRKVRPSDVVASPFPHVVITDALDDELCQQLIAEFPSLDVITEGASYGSNERFSYGATRVRGNEDVTKLWQQVVDYHTSDAFLQEVLTVFGDHIGAHDELRAGIRGADAFSTADVLLDAQLCVNTPVSEPSSVRGPHTDLGNKLFAGLYYLRDAEDDATGGDLEIYRFAGKREHFDGQFIDRKHVVLADTVPYAANTLVLFVNSIDALHGVTVRSATAKPRRFLNLLGEVAAPLFDHDAYQRRRRLFRR